MFFWIKVFKERPLSLSWVPADVVSVACFSLNRRFFNEMVLYREWFCEVEQPRQGQWWKRENTKSNSYKQNKTLNMQYTFWQILCLHRKTNVVKLDRLTSKIVVLSIAVVATSISSEIRIESATFHEKKLNEKRGWKMHCKLFLNTFPF